MTHSSTSVGLWRWLWLKHLNSRIRILGFICLFFFPYKFTNRFFSSELKKAQSQNCKREKFPVPDGSDHSNMETLDLKNEPSKNKATNREALPCASDSGILTPMQLFQAPNCSSVLLCEPKCVRICENAPVSIPDFSR